MIKEKKHLLVQQLEAQVREKRQKVHWLIGLGAGMEHRNQRVHSTESSMEDWELEGGEGQEEKNLLLRQKFRKNEVFQNEHFLRFPEGKGVHG